MDGLHMAIHETEISRAHIKRWNHDPIPVRISPEHVAKFHRAEVTLERQIGLGGCIAFVVGTVVGSGIFISPKGVLKNTGSVGMALMVWVTCGILSAIGALCYAELGTTIPKSGGDFTYILETFGAIPAFLRVWTNLVAVITAQYAVISVTGVTYMLKPIFGDCEIPYFLIQFLAVLLLVAIFWLNSVSVLWSKRVQIISTVAKVVELLLIIASGLYFMWLGQTGNLKQAFKPAVYVDLSKLPLAMYSGLFAYSGWQFLPSFTEEIVNPSRNIPLGIIISMIFVTSTYLLVNLAYFVVLDPLEVLSAEAVALTFSSRVLGNWALVISIAVPLSCIGSINGQIFSFARILMVSSREHCMPRILGMIHVHNKTPLPAAIAAFPIAVAMLMSRNIQQLVDYMSFTTWLLVSVAVAVIPYSRWKYPDLHRPFKVPIILPIIFITCALVVVATSLYSSPSDSGFGFIIALSGIPFYFIFVKWQSKPAWFLKAMDSLTCFMQRFLLVAPEEKNSD
ncbi:cystine/glutamate transporter-like [Asterias rubens]|uniref:cystine/glutamate transporter-like n=1 Tax=Asterias rubens TaxID=7604 RepID=UPI001455C5FA|nr:cystine/glutamate transporter-like [Asterias rubens]